MTVLETPFAVFEYSAADSLLRYEWFPSTKEMTWEELKAILKKCRGLVLKLRPEKILNNTHSFFYTIDLSEQNWIDVNLNRLGIQLGVQKIALIISTELIAQLSSEQVMEHRYGKLLMNLHYFDTEEEALQWLKQPAENSKSSS